MGGLIKMTKQNKTRKGLFLVLLVLAVLLLGTGFVSASLCQNSRGYYEDCGSTYSPSISPVTNYITYSRANDYAPIFKGAYGNYRYAMYSMGDYNPASWYQPRPTYSGYASGGFFGGYGGYGGYYAYHTPTSYWFY